MSSRSATVADSPRAGAVRKAVSSARDASSALASRARGSRVRRLSHRNAVARREAGCEHRKVTETDALLGDSACKIALQLCKSGRRPPFDPLVKCDLRTMAVEVADDADQLSWTIQSEEPLHHR